MKFFSVLRIKIIITILAVQAFMLSGIFLVLNLVLTANVNRQTDNFLEQLAKNGGHRPSPPKISGGKGLNKLFLQNGLPSSEFSDFGDAKAPNEIRNYFSVNVSYSGVINEVITDFPLSYTSDEISKIVILINSENQNKGIVNNFKYLKTEAKYGTFLICILNRTADFELIHQFRIYASLAIFGILLVSFALSLVISKITVKQAMISFENQRRFFADAGHELKTPIAVIGANIDVLSSDEKLNSNKFFQYIKSENERMGELVRDLLFLARDDADRLEIQKSKFDFSNAAENAVLPFEAVAFESGMTLNLDIQKGIICNGEEKSLKQLFVILVDNAIKNSDAGALISVKVFAERQNVVYKVRNTGNGIKKEELEKIFLRFYRTDSSRDRKTGGYGLGLSIAKTIAAKHGGTLKAESEYGKWAEFTFTMARKR